VREEWAAELASQLFRSAQQEGRVEWAKHEEEEEEEKKHKRDEVNNILGDWGWSAPVDQRKTMTTAERKSEANANRKLELKAVGLNALRAMSPKKVGKARVAKGAAVQ
jgi:hypothetical protein